MVEHPGTPIQPRGGFSYRYRLFPGGTVVYPIPKNASKSIIAASKPTPSQDGAIAFIRDPLERLVSYFENVIGAHASGLEWSGFIDSILTGRVDAHSLPQAHAICDGFAKWLYRFEEINDRLPGLQHLHSFPAIDVDQTYRLEEIQALYASDFELRQHLG